MDQGPLPPLVDIGANLTHDSFDRDRDAVVRRAVEAGVRHFVLTGADAEHSRQAAAMAAEDPSRFSATAGVHPHHAKDWDPSTAELILRLSRQEEVRSLGECGLDYFRNFSSHTEQERAFEAQLELAAELRMPVFLHQRDGHAEFLRILDRYLDRLPAAVAHCFTGGAEELDAYLERGLYIGITGWICDERRGEHLEGIVDRIPLDRIMVETDAPYLLPRDLDPKPGSRRNEPMYLPHVLRRVATAMGVGAAELAEATTRNATRFFGLPAID